MLSVKQHNENVTFSPELLAKFGEVVSRYPEGKQKSGLLPILHLVQAEYGWVSADAMDKVAVYLNILPIEVYEVATFYTMFLLQPKGKYVLEICRTGTLVCQPLRDVLHKLRMTHKQVPAVQLLIIALLYQTPGRNVE
jgi:NADH-quinone oxidoreductase subunit E